MAPEVQFGVRPLTSMMSISPQLGHGFVSMLAPRSQNAGHMATPSGILMRASKRPYRNSFLFLGDQSCRCVLAVFVLFLARLDDQCAVVQPSVGAWCIIGAAGVVLQFVVVRVGHDQRGPCRGINAITLELVGPHQFPCHRRLRSLYRPHRSGVMEAQPATARRPKVRHERIIKKLLATGDEGGQFT